MKIVVSTQIQASLEEVWSAWTTPEHIVKWNFASDEWHCPRADLELTPGGVFSYRMEAKDGSMGFDFGGKFTAITPMSLIAYSLGDERSVSIEFRDVADGVEIVETFDAEDEMSGEQQRQGWQAILENFKAYVEGNAA